MFIEKHFSQRDKIFTVITNFDFDKYSTSNEWVNLYIDVSGYPVFKKKNNSVEVKLIYTSASERELKDINFTVEIFVYGKTIVTSRGKVPELCLKIARILSEKYFESIKNFQYEKVLSFPYENKAIG